jgi:putative heme-binding domain-containing protein
VLRTFACFALPVVAPVVARAAEAVDPASELAALRVLPGYEVSLFASEAEGVVKPIQIRFDPAGRLWVAGSTVYPQIQPGEAPHDKIVVLEDADGDGKADRSTVFADGLMIPTGIELGDGGVYVGQGNELLFLRDTDGDGRADERRVVLRGFGTGDAHQTINSFTWSPGGKLLFCQGLHAFSRVETPWGIEELRQAGVWRFHPRLLRLDSFLNEAMGPQNPFGVAFDRWGQPILVAGNGEGVYYLTPGMTRSQERHPLRALWNTGRKFGGADFVENGHWPAEAQGELITGSYLNNAVYRFRITEENSGFKAEDLPPLITSTNTSFRIVDVRFGPDGALYLCDWFNPIIGHYQASFRHPDRDKAHGRIWRVTATGRSLVARPSLAGASTADLLRQLGSPERWTRQMAKRVLADRPAAAVRTEIAKWLPAVSDTGEALEHLRMEVLGVYESLEVVEPRLLAQVLASRDPRARAYAAGVAGRWASRLEDPVAILDRAVADPSPRVRLEAVVAASYVPDPRALAVVLRCTEEPVDGFLEYAARQAIRVLKPLWAPALREGRFVPATQSAALQLWVTTDRSPDTLSFVTRRLREPGVDAESRFALMQVLGEAGGPDELALLLPPSSNPGIDPRALGVLVTAARSRGIRPVGDLSAVIEAALGASETATREQAIRLCGAWGQAAFRSRVEDLARGAGDRPSGERRAAMSALGFYGDAAARDLLTRLGAASADGWVEAIEALATLDLKGAAAVAARRFARADAEESASSRLMAVFLGRHDGATALAAALEPVKSTIARSAAQAGLDLMNRTGRRPERLAALLADAARQEGPASTLSAAGIREFAFEVATKGDPMRGELIFRRPDLNCSACHAVGGKGGNIGPDLGALGTAQTVEFIIGAVVNPQKEVKEGYTAYAITTRSGEEYQGYVVRESGTEVVLRDVLLQQEVRVARDRIQELRKVGSLMPAGLVDGLSREEFRDLVRYLSGLGRP